MANKEHLAIFKKGVSAWNKWRTNNRVRPNLSEANLRGVDLSKANLRGVDLSKANLAGAKLYRADCTGFMLRNKSGHKFIHTDLSQANLSQANLIQAKLDGANLSGANLSEANLTNAILSGANLSNADLSKANFSGATLIETNLKGANINGIYVKGTLLSKIGFEDPDLIAVLQKKSYGLIEIDPLTVLIDPGDATAEDLSELFVELSILYRMIGGSGIDFRIAETKEPAAVYVS